MAFRYFRRVRRHYGLVLFLLLLIYVCIIVQTLVFHEISCATKLSTALRSEADDGTLKVKVSKLIHEKSFRIDLERSDAAYSADDLEHIKVPGTVHYVWCKNSSIKFENYLSVMSVWKLFQPDSIEFHTKYNISDIDDKYNLWLKELKYNIPGFRQELLPEHWDNEEYGCGIWFAIAVLDDRGGIYFSEDLIITNKVRKLRQNEFSLALQNNSKISILMSTAKNENLQILKRNLKLNKGFPAGKLGKAFECISLDLNSGTTNRNFSCAHVPFMYPRDIMNLNTSFGELSRFVLYNERQTIAPGKFLPGKIPKIIHLVWYRRKEMEFLMYLSLRSTLTIVKPDKIYIHGDKELYGPYLDEFANDSRIIWVVREEPFYVYGKRILFTQHKSDIIRADVLSKFGGVYMDWDVIWLKPIDDLLNTGYDAIVNIDHMSSSGYPDAMNLGVLMAKPQSDFVRLWQESLKNYRSYDFYFNALELPYKIFEKYPHTVHIEKRLQVMCFHLKCHPIFHKDYKKFTEEQPFDWRKDVYAIHFTYPDPPEYANKSALLRSSGMFADIGRYILKQPYVAGEKL